MSAHDEASEREYKETGNTSSNRDDDYSRDKHREESTRAESSRDESPQEYTLSKLKAFLASKKFFITRQFVSGESVIYIKVYCESVGENILVYFPSKYNILPEIGTIPITDINSYELTDSDLLSVYKKEEEDMAGQYKELQLDELKDVRSFTEDNYKPIDIEGSITDIRKKIVRYNAQLNKFKIFTSKLKYKFSIITNNILCSINRHNDIDSYIIKNGRGLVPNIIDVKTETVEKIEHELYIVIDLPSFYEKLTYISTDLIKLYKSFYSSLTSTHTKQTAIVQTKFKNYQQIVLKMSTLYDQKSKYLTLLDSLTTSLEKTLQKETQLNESISILNKDESTTSTLTSDKNKSFKINKYEQDLSKLQTIKKKTVDMLQELKRKMHSFLVSFDHTITETHRDLVNIEERMKLMGITAEVAKK